MNTKIYYNNKCISKNLYGKVDFVLIMKGRFNKVC